MKDVMLVLIKQSSSIVDANFLQFVLHLPWRRPSTYIIACISVGSYCVLYRNRSGGRCAGGRYQELIGDT